MSNLRPTVIKLGAYEMSGRHPILRGHPSCRVDLTAAHSLETAESPAGGQAAPGRDAAATARAGAGGRRDSGEEQAPAAGGEARPAEGPDDAGDTSGTGVEGAAAVGRGADKIIARAEQRAAEILTRAGMEAAEAADRAAAEARAAAIAEVEEQVSGRLADARKAAEEIVATAEAQRDVILAAAQRELLALALEIARRVVAREVRVSPDVVLAVAEEAIGHLPEGAGAVELRVHPEDRELVAEHRRRLMAAAAGLSDLSTKEDSAVSRGGCIAVTAAGEVDARVETRLKRLGAALRGDEEPDGTEGEEERHSECD